MSQQIDIYFQKKPNHYIGNIGVAITYTDVQSGVAELIAETIADELGNRDFAVNINKSGQTRVI